MLRTSSAADALQMVGSVWGRFLGRLDQNEAYSAGPRFDPALNLLQSKQTSQQDYRQPEDYVFHRDHLRADERRGSGPDDVALPILDACRRKA